MTQKKNNLMPCNEIMSVYLTEQMSDEDLARFKLDPVAVIADKSGVDVSSINFQVVENAGTDIHLGLPYYDSLSSGSSYELSDDDLEAISGGEIFIAVSCLIGAGIGMAAVGTAKALFVGGAVGAAVGAGILATTATAGTIAAVEVQKRK